MSTANLLDYTLKLMLIFRLIMKRMSTSDFDYDLPEDLIAQYPLPVRTDSRLMVLKRETKTIEHHSFSDIIHFISPNDLCVLNDTKVIPARLLGIKESGGKIECLIERVISTHEALAHIRSSKSPRAGTRLILEKTLTATVLDRRGELFHLRFDGDICLLDQLEQFGHIPLPPYIHRPDEINDRDRYQTVFAEKPGAVAAPTASLHFSKILLQNIAARGTAFAQVTLHVGSGTFQPVRVDDISQHHMHSEWIDVSKTVVDAAVDCHARHGKVMAIGTTALRALESAALTGQLQSYQGETDIFIYPGFSFRCVDTLLTNFHLPKSTLLMLVSAFGGTDFLRQAYEVAIQERYRFFSYGDAMLIL